MAGGYDLWVDPIEGALGAFPFGETPVPVILDTDTYNEIDDQFALVWTLLSPEAVDLRAVTAAPFLNQRSTSAEDGMVKSLEEIYRILDLMGADSGLAAEGSRAFCGEVGGVVESPAAVRIIEEARKCDGKLVVVAIGAPTNVASALMMEPGLKDQFSVVWLGGHGYWHKDTNEFNMVQDVLASRTLMDLEVPLVQIPCHGVATHLSLTRAEVEASVRPCGGIGEFLAERFCEEVQPQVGAYRVIWDLAAVAAVVMPSALDVRVHPSPVLEDGLFYRFEEGRRMIQACFGVDRSAVFGDLWVKLAENSRI